MIPVELGGVRDVVLTRGESDWVGNLRAAGRVELGGRDYAATEVPVAEREAIIAAYRTRAGRAVVTYWKTLPSAQDHLTFRLGPA